MKTHELKKKLVRHSWWSLPVYLILGLWINTNGLDTNSEIALIVLTVLAVGLEIQSYHESKKIKKETHTWKVGESKKIPKKKLED